MEPTESKQNLLNCGDFKSSEEDYNALKEIQDKPLSEIEKTFLLHGERGDVATVRRIIEEYKDFTEEFDINCVDALNRSALISAIENENIELIKILLDKGIAVKDGLLHAIKEEYVEAVEVLLVFEEKNHILGEPYSWEKVDRCSSTFTADITPLILAAHKNNFEIIKILLDRGATLPMPHDVRCGCDHCVTSSAADSLQHSQSRINAYRALTAPSLIALSSSDPILTAFQLSWELRRLSRMETEFRAEYNEMRAKVQTFATSLLNHVRSSFELEVMLNYDPTGDTWDPGEHQNLERLKLGIKYKQKQFIAHPNVQQLLAALWYEGLPGFRRKGLVGQMVQVAKMGMMFPVYCSIYIVSPDSEMGSFMKKPFVKFICHSSSYAFFLMLLGAASQRIEILFLEFFGNEWMRALVQEWKRKERGAWPGLAEYGVIIYVIGIIWGEISALYKDGIEEYVTDLWNILDFITNFFYVIWLAVRISACFVTWREERQGLNPWYPREQWDMFEPMLISEGAFAAGMIFSFLKLVHIFSINPHLGPLQISLGRMIIDIIKFFFIYTLVLFAFGCGLNQLLWYYAELEKDKCYHLPSGLPDFENQDKACTIWRRYANLFETSQSLFWASFGLVDLVSFDLAGIKGFTRFWALLMFGSYSVINIIVLLNMLIAMMSNSYQIISERSDTEWKFARSKLWMSYFEDDVDLPPPFNLMPQFKSFLDKCKKKQRTKSFINKSMERCKSRYNLVMKLLIRRYVTAEQRNRDDFGISEDDVMEIRQDISSLRYELIDILRQNGMSTPKIASDEVLLAGKKCKLMERRILKDFQIGLMGGVAKSTMETFGKDTKDVFGQLAKAIARKTTSKKKDWNELVRKNTATQDQIGSMDVEEKARQRRRSLRRKSQDEEGKQRKARRFPPLAEVIKLGQMESAAASAHIQLKQDQEKKVSLNKTGELAPPKSVQPKLSPTPEEKNTGRSPSLLLKKAAAASPTPDKVGSIKAEPSKPAVAPPKPTSAGATPAKPATVAPVAGKPQEPSSKPAEPAVSLPAAKPANIKESTPKPAASTEKSTVKPVETTAKPTEVAVKPAAPTAKPTEGAVKPAAAPATSTSAVPPKPQKAEEAKDDKKSVEFTCQATVISEIPRPSKSATGQKKNLPWL